MSTLVHIFIVIVLTLIRKTDQCIALGCLGGFGGCGSACLFGLCLQPPMIQSIGCPCGVGFMCIRGGCVARAAAGTKTFKDDSSISPEVKETLTPDEHFSTCCSLLDVPSSCTGLCSYSSYSAEEVSAAFLQQSSCPVESIRKIHFCAARGVNHTECCVNSLVPSHCQSFCDQTGDKDDGGMSISHLQCVQYFNDIKTCFVEHANSEYFEGSKSRNTVELTRNDNTMLGANF